jgi:carbon-monoxide dehydrogenase medium subunit
MPSLDEYHRPEDLAQALTLLGRTSPRTVALAGGTWLNPRLGKLVQAEAVVDLGALGLDGVVQEGSWLRLGAMTTLAAVTQDETCRAVAEGILAATARRDATLQRRNTATVGGTVVVAPADSEFLLALLALGAELTIRSGKLTTVALAEFLGRPQTLLNGGLVTGVRIRVPQQAAAGQARVSRTPSDHPIVAAVAVVAAQPDVARVAIGGVSARPLVVETMAGESMETALAEAVRTADVVSDFCGSARYRRAIGLLLGRRALARAMARGARSGEVR